MAFYDSNNQPATGKRFGVRILAQLTLQPLVGATDRTTHLIRGGFVKATIKRDNAAARLLPFTLSVTPAHMESRSEQISIGVDPRPLLTLCPPVYSSHKLPSLSSRVVSRPLYVTGTPGRANRISSRSQHSSLLLISTKGMQSEATAER